VTSFPCPAPSLYRSTLAGVLEGASAHLCRKDGLDGTCQRDALTLEYQPTLWVGPLERHNLPFI
jgi:hypothetical protein